jgi:hypothetical protein
MYEPAPPLDFQGESDHVWVVAEGQRLSHGYLYNPTFATEISVIDPLPHQRIAVYEHMLTQPRLRFLLADDAGAGKTIITGLYVREMLARRLIRRVLIVPPAGLIGNWRRELLLPLRIAISDSFGGRTPTSTYSSPCTKPHGTAEGSSFPAIMVTLKIAWPKAGCEPRIATR